MKGKNVFFALGLSLVMGLGAVAALSGAREIRQAKAVDLPADTHIYLDFGGQGKGWAADGANVYAWVFYGTSSWENVTYDSTSEYYTFTLSSAASGFTLLREAGDATPRSGTSWGTGDGWNKKDVNFEADKNLLSATTAGSVGSWSYYDGTPAVHTYGVVGSFTSWGTDPDIAMTVVGDTATVELDLVKNDSFKIRRDGVWGTEYDYRNLDSESKEYLDESEDTNHNMVAKADGVYEISLAISSGTVTVSSFTPAVTKYYAKVAAGEFTEMTYEGSFKYDEDTKTGYTYSLVIDASAGQRIQFRRGASTVIYPGASDSDLTNNLFHNWTSDNITVVSDADDETLTLKVYEDGYDSFLTGYVAAPRTYYFTNNKGWVGTPKLYAYNDNDIHGQPSTHNVDWPGQEMTYVDVDKYSQPNYTFTIDAVKFPNFVIANNDGSEQTVDSKFASYMKNGFYLGDKDGEGKYEIAVFDYEEIERTVWIGGVKRTLTESADQPGGDVLIQYETAKFDMKGGDQIRYEINSQNANFSLQQYFSNNARIVETQPKVLADAEDKVYVKIMTDFSTKIYVGGNSGMSQSFNLLISNPFREEVTILEMEQNPNNSSEYYSAAHQFYSGDTFEIINATSENALPGVYNPAGGLNEHSVEGFAVQDGVVKCTKNTVTSAYIQLEFENDKLYFGAVSEQAVLDAIEFATYFKSQMVNSCSQESSKQDYVEAAWATSAAQYATLSADAKSVLAEGQESAHDDIVDFAKRYVGIKTQHSDWTLDDFMNWVAPSARIVPARAINSNVMVYILVIGAVATASLVGLFFVIRRRKEVK